MVSLRANQQDQVSLKAESILKQQGWQKDSLKSCQVQQGAEGNEGDRCKQLAREEKQGRLSLAIEKITLLGIKK